MNRDPESVEWPAEAGDPTTLPGELPPPAALEDRVVATLQRRGLIRAAPSTTASAWRPARVALATAACLGLVVVGVLIGRLTRGEAPTSMAALTGSETDLYAVLLYETAGYDRPAKAELRTRYDEYSRWVAEARRRDQFVTGEDLNADQGWLVFPSADGPAVESATHIDAGAPLSGVFFLRAANADDVLDLVRKLPHVKHGGRVLVQKTIPTDSPPAGDG